MVARVCYVSVSSPVCKGSFFVHSKDVSITISITPADTAVKWLANLHGGKPPPTHSWDGWNDGRTVKTGNSTKNAGIIFHKDANVACGASQMNCTNVGYSGSARGGANVTPPVASVSLAGLGHSRVQWVGKGSAVVPKAREEKNAPGTVAFHKQGASPRAASPPVLWTWTAAPFLCQLFGAQTGFDCLFIFFPLPVAVVLKDLSPNQIRKVNSS